MISGSDIAYVPLAHTAAHLAILLAALFGFIGFALGSTRYAPMLIAKVPPPHLRLAARVVGWVLIAATFIGALALANGDTGPVYWFGWLSVAGVALTLAMWKWSRQPARKAREPRAAAAPATLRSTTLRHAVGIVGLIATVAVFAYTLLRAVP